MPEPSGPEPSGPEPSEPEAAAQEPHRPEPTTPGRDRLVAALRRPSRGQAVVGVLLAVVGFAAVTQVRDNQLDDTYAGSREQDLIDVLNGLTGTAQRARAEIARLERTRDDLRSETTSRQAALAQAEERAQTLNILAGTVPVTGPGLRITITEETGRVSVGSLLDTVEELRTAGAEAMEFDQRIRLVAESSFDLTTGGIELDGEVLESPYVIEVIGDPSTLRGALVFRSGPIETLEQDDGASVVVEQLDAVDIESVVED